MTGPKIRAEVRSRAQNTCEYVICIRSDWGEEKGRTGPLVSRTDPRNSATVVCEMGAYHWRQSSKLLRATMKTKWGSCNASAGTIRLNSELAKKPRECLEYLVVHEMVHLLERTHNRRFMSLMEHFMPRWQSHRDLLNPLPVRREKWVYCVLTTTVPCIDLIVFPSRTTVVLLYSCRSPRAECQMRAISQSARSRSTRYTMRYGRKIISRILSSLYSGTTRPNSGNSCRRSVSEISSIRRTSHGSGYRVQ